MLTKKELEDYSQHCTEDLTKLKNKKIELEHQLKKKKEDITYLEGFSNGIISALEGFD